MYIFEPVIHETLWGGRRLKRYYDTGKRKAGHLYMVNGHKEMPVRLLNGQEAGKTLYELFLIHQKEWNLAEFEEFPLTIALVDASDDLSIQVHPDDQAAWELEGKKSGKTESWFFLEPPEAGWIYGGCPYGSIPELRTAVDRGCAGEAAGRLPVHKFDYAGIGAGTLHAMTKGCLAYEIEYGSDVTYRFYDHGRLDEQGNPRPLHLKKAFTSVRPEKMPKICPGRWNTWISEEFYEICPVRNLRGWKNENREIACITLFEGGGSYEGTTVVPGMGLLLFPGESLCDIDIRAGMIARIVRQGQE